MLESLEYNAALIEKYLRNELTEIEKKELADWINASDDNKKKFEEWTDTTHLVQKLEALDRVENRKQEAWQKAEWQLSQEQPGGKLVIFRWWKYAVAAAVIILVAGYWLLETRKPEVGPQNGKKQEVAVTPDVKAPEMNRAMITLADGRMVYLDSTGNGQLATEGNIKLVKLSDGKIAYEAAGSSHTRDGELRYNTITNPKGSKVIDISLADGSRVWLNAASSLKYPVAFVGHERKVEITGEAYFEVAKSFTASGAKQSFVVSKGDMQVTVLGTHFNVNAYDDEADIKVTLLEGSVKVASPSRSGGAKGGALETLVLKPGEQAVTGLRSPLTIHHSPDLEQVMAWKNGYFQFDRDDLQTVMRQIARWYNVEIVYEGKIPERFFGGKIHRNTTVSEVLTILERYKVRFRIEGKKIIVMP